jgi:hypothetical protein
VPFTLSHPAAVIPFCRGRLVPSALVIGSMAPDAPYFLGMADLRGATHEPLGLVTVDLALGLLLFIGFHGLWKHSLLALAPLWAYERLRRPAEAFRLGMVTWVPVSILVGAATHLLWDGFTHLHHSFAGRLPWLVTVSWGGLELFRWLQYVSGVGGAVVIVWWTVRWFRTAGEEPAAGPVTWRTAFERGAWSGTAMVRLAMLGAATAAGGVLGAILLINHEGPRTLHVTLANAVEGAIAGMAVVLTVSGCVDRVRRTRLNA